MTLLVGYGFVSVIFFGSLAFMASQPAPVMEQEVKEQLVEEECEREESFALHSA